MPHPRNDDDALAKDLAERAGSLLVTLRKGPLEGRELGAEGDRRSNALIVERLRSARPGDAILSEEGVDDPTRLGASRVWIVDPLDGTREYSEAGRTDWAVHIALWEQGSITTAVVGLPAQGAVLEAWSPPGLSPLAEPLRMVVSRSRPPNIAEPVARSIGARLVPLGSAGAKAAAVMTGQADLYLHAGGQYEWDSAAPVGVALSAGLHASRIDGSPLRYNRADPTVPDLLVCHRELAKPALASIADQVTGRAPGSPGISR